MAQHEERVKTRSKGAELRHEDFARPNGESGQREHVAQAGEERTAIAAA